MTTQDALEVRKDKELRTALRQIALSGTAGPPERFLARAWAAISQMRAGRDGAYYLARVIVQCCRPRWARPHQKRRIKLNRVRE